MGQKINPISLRLQSTNRHFESCWYSNYFYKNLLNKEIFLQHYFNNFLKLLKLPTGRYSIQHLQKKTQVYNFLCYSKSTREWRCKLFGLVSKIGKKKQNRFFFKNKTQFKKRKKSIKWNFFYNTLNQLTIYKIQKRITSFQNFQLWSALQPSHKNLSRSIIENSTHKFINLSNSLLPKSTTWFSLSLKEKLNLNLKQTPFLIKKKINLLTLKSLWSLIL